MNSVNSKNMTFIILFVALLLFAFIAIFISNQSNDIIYTDLEELGIED